MCAVGALIVVDVEAFYPLPSVPLYPFSKVRPFVLGNGTYGKVYFRRLRVVLQFVLEFERIYQSKP